jgi:hypothetical protein
MTRKFEKRTRLQPIYPRGSRCIAVSNGLLDPFLPESKDFTEKGVHGLPKRMDQKDGFLSEKFGGFVRSVAGCSGAKAFTCPEDKRTSSEHNLPADWPEFMFGILGTLF